MSALALDSFNRWIAYALSDLARLPSRDMRATRSILIDMALGSLRNALRRANEMRDPARKALCLRLMNWLRADLRRTA